MSDENSTQSEHNPNRIGCLFHFLLPFYALGGAFHGMIVGVLVGGQFYSGRTVLASMNDPFLAFVYGIFAAFFMFFPVTILASLAGWFVSVIVATFELVTRRRAIVFAFVVSLLVNAVLIGLSIAYELEIFFPK